MEKKDELQCCVTTCDKPLNADYWDQHYKNNDTGWDLKGVSPPIKLFVDSLTDKDISILIPGCGNAYEAEYLLQQGFTNVTLIDIAGTLVTALQQKFAGKPIHIVHGNFFQHQQKYDLIIEQTFFCALNPALRQQYAAKCYSLLNNNGRVAGLLFNVIFEKAGPPFGGTRQEYVQLFEPIFELKQFEPCTTSIKPRLGNELFIEMVKRDPAVTYVTIYNVSGITCTGCRNTLSEQIFKVPNVKSVSINSDNSEVLVVASQPVSVAQLQQALATGAKYQLSEMEQ